LRVLVVGANGFIGRHIVARLRAAGYDVVAAVRRPTAAAGCRQLVCDFGRDTDARIWRPRLDGIGAVVNCAGILRETPRATFQSVHVDAPLALFRACADTGVRRVVQVSALGAAEDGEFIASKHRCDAALARLDLDWFVLRPSLVYSTRSAYGGTALLRALAVLPGILVVPGDGSQMLRPVAAQDLADAVVRILADPALRGGVIELVGPEVLALRDYLLAWRGWFGLGTPRVIGTPRRLADAAVAIGEFSGRGPLCRVIANLLERGRIGATDAPATSAALLGRAPSSLADALARRASELQDLILARWYLLRGLMLLTLALVWIGSGAVGLATPLAAMQAALPGWPRALLRGLALAGSGADLVLGMALLASRNTRLVLVLMLAAVTAYTLLIGIVAPRYWLDPFGSLLKNLPIAALLIALLALPTHRE
jgi:uncharacterized protein YbjT (DUF2867 family)